MKACPFSNKIPISSNVCNHCKLNALSVCQTLDQDDQKLLCDNGNIIRFSEGETIFKQGVRPQGLYCLIESHVKIEKRNEDGSLEILSLHKPVEFLGLTELVRGPDLHGFCYFY